MHTFAVKNGYMEIVMIYLLGVLVARVQLQYWFRERLLLDEDYQTLAILSALSWAIYPAYLIEYVLERLNIK